jgi:hypothetical protein
MLIVECPTVRCIKVSVDLDALILAVSPSSPPIYPHAVNILHTPKITKNRCQQRHLLLVRLKDFNETKHTRHHPWCGDDAYVLGWGVIKPQAMVEAEVTPVFLNKCVAEGGFGPGTILRRITYDRKSRDKMLLTTGRHWVWGVKWGGTIRLPPPNRFAQVKTFSCNRR